VTLAYPLLHPDLNDLTHLPSSGIDKITFVLYHRIRFPGDKTIVDSTATFQEDGIGRDQLLIANNQLIVHVDMFQQDALLYLFIDPGDCYGKIGFIVPVEGECFISLPLVPFSNQQEEDKSRQAVTITRSPGQQNLIGRDQEEDTYAQGNG